jgi:beta-lactamase superfamily II metal-dependent hydrolase
MNLRFRFLLIIFACAASGTAFAGPKDQRLDVYWVDVEGGAATLLVTPAGETVLVDAGNPGRRDADRIVRVLTETAGLREINHLITTHYHGDHYGGASSLSKLVPVRSVYDNGTFAGMPERPAKEYFEFKCDRRVVINPGDKLELKPATDSAAKVLATCLGTRQQFIAAPSGAAANEAICAAHKPKDRDGSDNANSVVMLFGLGDFRLFDAGDLTWNVERNLVCPVNLVGKVDVYQVTHHGLSASNNPIVLATLNPTVAVMNNGVRKGCEPEVFATLKGTKSLEAIYQVHKNLRSDGAVNNVADEFIANREEKCKGNYIKLSVAPDGKSYTISIPANGHEKTYRSR